VNGIVFHKNHRIGWHHSRHTYLVDVGSDIEIRELEISDLFEDRLLDPPHPSTRYFEIEIDEIPSGGTRSFVFKNIWPVRARRKPDWHILKFRIRRGSWTITERIRSESKTSETQWIYSDDFNMLFISSGGRHDGAMLASLIVEKLHLIAQSIRSGTPVLSEFENQQSCRSAFGEIFADGVDGAFRDTGVYRQHASAISAELAAGHHPPSATPGIDKNHGRLVVSNPQAADLAVDINQIEELQDLSWLND
jgi:hypothetical protein